MFFTNGNLNPTYKFLLSLLQLIIDFANRVESTVDKFQDNFEQAVSPLATILSLDEIPLSELGKAHLLQKVETHFEASSQNFPCVQFCDVSLFIPRTKMHKEINKRSKFKM